MQFIDHAPIAYLGAEVGKPDMKMARVYRPAEEVFAELWNDPLVPWRPPSVETGRKRNAVFVRPELVAEIEFRAWTHDGKLRHASYKGLRDEQDEAAVYSISA